MLNDHRSASGWSGTGTRAEGYLVGLLLGDGTLKQEKAVLSVWAPELRVAGSNQSIHAYSGAEGVIRAAEAAIVTLPHRTDFKGFQKPVTERGERRLASAALRDLAFNLGMSPGNKTITPEIEKQSSEFYAGFLRGFFDADGSVQGQQDKGVSVRLAQSDLATIQAVAAGGMSIGQKGMMVAAKTMTLTAMEIFNNPSVTGAALEELNKRRGEGFTYEALVGNRQPPLDYRK